MINFNNIPDTTRTPSIYTEVDNSRALQGLFPNPHKVLILGDKTSTGSETAAYWTLKQITNNGLADGFFGAGSELARMCNMFKLNNPNTELHAIAVSGGTAQASAEIVFSTVLSHAAGGDASTNGEFLFLLVNGQKAYTQITSGWSAIDIASNIKTYINAQGNFPVNASVSATSGVLLLSCKNSGTQGNYLDVRFNYFEGQSYPTCFGVSEVNRTPSATSFTGGVADTDLDDAWSIIENQQYHYIIQPYIDATNLTSIETELETRFEPLEDLQGQGFTVVSGTQASCTTLGNTRNSPHNTIMGVYDSPTSPEEWSAALGGKAARYLNDDPARPLHYIKLEGVLPPPVQNRFTRTERDILLTDGIATYRVDESGNVIIDRAITTYQTNDLSIPDTSYLDVTTLATLSAIRYQFKSRMILRFIIPRMKLADDTFPVQPGSNVVTPSVIKGTIIALFTELRDAGLIENLADFIDNLIVERNATDKNRIDVLLPPDLINQFRVLAAKLQFLL